MDVIIYHNPKCATSRNMLGLIRNAGVEPHVIDYQKCPPTRLLLTQLLAARASACARSCARRARLIRSWGSEIPPWATKRCSPRSAHPILMNRPLVVTPKGVRLCRPSESVIDLLPPQRGEFFKEGGERVVDEKGRRVATA